MKISNNKPESYEFLIQGLGFGRLPRIEMFFAAPLQPRAVSSMAKPRKKIYSTIGNL